MKADYKLGVCFSNDDPNSLGRIRVIPIEILGKLATLSDILSFINNEDIKAENGLIYKPWAIVKTDKYKEKDKYVCDPFLPRNIGVTPNPGQLVKIIKYDDLSSKSEFIGPYTIDQITLTEEYRNVINNIQKTINVSEVLPRKGKTFISGYNNEQVIMGDNEFLVRLGHINTNNKTRKNTYPFIQLSQFNNSFLIKDKSRTITESPDVYIDYILELYLNYKPKDNKLDKNFEVELLLYDTNKIKNSKGQFGLTKNTYNQLSNYINKDTDNFVVKYIITSSNITEITKIIEDIISGFNSGGIVKYYDVNISGSRQKIENDVTTINIINNIPETPNIGGANNENNVVPNLKNWLFRLENDITINNFNGSLLEPNVAKDNIKYIRFLDYRGLDSFITKYNQNKRFGLLAIDNSRTFTITEPTTESTGNPQSIMTTYSDKLLFLSSINSSNLIDDFTNDGISSNKLSEFIGGVNQNVKTYGFIRAEKLMELLDEILDMFLKHGHEAGVDPRASIIESTQDIVENIRKKIKDELKPTNNNIIINHNLRLN